MMPERRLPQPLATLLQPHELHASAMSRCSAHITGENAVGRESLHAGGVRCTLAVSSDAAGKTNWNSMEETQ
jgi:hypothetical protein